MLGSLGASGEKKLRDAQVESFRTRREHSFRALPHPKVDRAAAN